MSESRLDLVSRPNIYSWGARVNFVLGNGYEIKQIQPQLEGGVAPMSLCWGTHYAVTLEGRAIHPELTAAGQRGYRLEILANATASSAEESGIQLCLGLLWMAVSEGFGVSLDWPDSPLPCRVVDRLASRGITGQAFGSVKRNLELSAFVRRLEEGFGASSAVSRDRLLLSMELIAGAKLEASGRAKFVMIVSGIEALVDTADHPPEVAALVKELNAVVDRDTSISPAIKSGLKSKLGQLRKESILQGLRRTLLGLGTSDPDLASVVECYDLRSQIVHRGARVPELLAKAARLEQIMKSVYANALGAVL